MESSDQNITPEGFDANRVGYLLDSAHLAEQGGNSRLAIHLYCAAFEASQENEKGIDERTLDGLRKAWILACEQGDRATAETIFNDLSPYNSDEQTQLALAELREMATQQLGINKDELEDIAIAFADEVRDAGIDVDALVDRFATSQNKNESQNKINLSNLGSLFMEGSLPGAMLSAGSSEPQEAQDAPGGEISLEELNYELRYANLVGFDKVKEKMHCFGIVDPNDTKMLSFLQQAESFHGMSGPVLSQNLLFVGSSREDTGIFAQATANEIGWPVVTIVVDINENNDGTIKVMAPVKRSFFGPPRITDLPNPCILVIQNVDILQELFWGEEQAMSKGYGPYGYAQPEDITRFTSGTKPPGQQGGAQAHPHRSLQLEILGYLDALFARGGVFIIATSAASSAEQPLVLSERLEGFLGTPAEVAVDAPTEEERRRVLQSFSIDHPSLHDLDISGLARLSEGMSRFEIVMSCRRAVELAYSQSLKMQRHQMVSLEDILTQFSHFMTPGTTTYNLIEDYLVARFSEDLEQELLYEELHPSKISLDLKDEQRSDEDTTER